MRPEQLNRYPNEPGVYLMKNKAGVVIYVGKAKELKTRIKQYFTEKGDGRPIIPFLMREVVQIDTLVVPTEKEALLLENTLIKKHQPKYNALLKDDKTFISLMIDPSQQWPMLRLVRYKGKEPLKGLYFGPYTSAHAARQTFELLTRLFPLRQCSDDEFKRRTRPCLLYGMKRCIAPCVGKCSKEEYSSFVESTIRFLRGEDREIIKNLKVEMQKAAATLEYERAAALLRTIRQIEHVTESRRTITTSGSTNIDVLGLFREGDEVILMQLLFREGKLVGSEYFSFSRVLESDHELISSFLLQHYQKATSPPHLILLPVPLQDTPLLTQILEELHHKKLQILTPVKGEKKDLVALADKNAQATFRQEKDASEMRERMLLDLQESLKLNRYPKRIECFDTSNISGTDPVASMIAFTEGEKDKKRTRLFRIKNLDQGDDYSALREALSRRLKRAKEEDDLPDLVIVDGGKGQLNILLETLKDLDIASVDAVGIAKENSRHDRGLTQEKIYLPHVSDPLLLNLHSPLLFLLQQIRDEAHRVAISFHRKRREKRTITSELDAIPGIGRTKRTRLLRHFGSIQQVFAASRDELKQVQGLTEKDIATLLLAKKAKPPTPFR